MLCTLDVHFWQLTIFSLCFSQRFKTRSYFLREAILIKDILKIYWRISVLHLGCPCLTIDNNWRIRAVFWTSIFDNRQFSDKKCFSSNMVLYWRISLLHLGQKDLGAESGEWEDNSIKSFFLLRMIDDDNDQWWLWQCWWSDDTMMMMITSPRIHFSEKITRSNLSFLPLWLQWW